jgi:hypothetical protein
MEKLLTALIKQFLAFFTTHILLELFSGSQSGPQQFSSRPETYAYATPFVNPL